MRPITDDLHAILAAADPGAAADLAADSIADYADLGARLSASDASRYAVRLQRALGAARWRVEVFDWKPGANVELRPLGQPQRPAVVLRTAAACEAYLTAWAAPSGRAPQPPAIRWHAGRYAGVREE